MSLQNPVFATMVMLAFVVLGLFSYQRLAVDQFPNIDFPVVVVVTDYPGASPEVVESEVTKQLEEAVNAIAGINALTSRSYEGSSVLIIEFQLHMDGRKAADDVREKVAQVKPLLRDEVEEPRVLRFDPANAPVWSVAVIPNGKPLLEGTQAMSAVQLSTWAEQTLKKRLENVRGVGAVNLVGDTPREINIYLDPTAMQALAITPAQVVAAVRSENQDAPVGAIRSLAQERMVQVLGRIERPEHFGDIIVAWRDGAPVRLGQVARVHDGPPDVQTLALFNGTRTLLLSVQKAQDENTIAVVQGLNDAIAQLEAQLPPGVVLKPIADMARPIQVAVDNVRQTLIEGAVLTVVIVFLFLNSWRSTIITGLTLPIALIGTFWFMQMMGFTLNMITLMALSLSVGLLIDDAIVVRENIVRHIAMGKRPWNAAMDGTREIGLAVLATTLSIVAVFLPIGFMEGIIGKFFHEFGLTIVVAVLISMFVSFTLDPMLSSIWHDPHLHGSRPSSGTPSLYDRTLGRVTAWFEKSTDELASSYQRILRWALGHRLATVLGALVIFVGSLLMVPLLGSEFMPQTDFSETRVSFKTPEGSSLEMTEAKALQVEAILRELPEVDFTLTTINTGDSEGKNEASIFIRLQDRSTRERNVADMSLALRQALRSVPGIQVTHVGLLEPVGGQKQIEVSIMGPDLGELARLNNLAWAQLQQVPGLVDLESSMQSPKPMVAVNIQREAAADVGLSVGSIASSLRTLIAGQTVGNWRASDDQTYDINVRLAPEMRTQAEQLQRLPLTVSDAQGQPQHIQLGQVAQVAATSGPAQINRRAMLREVQFTANVSLRSMGEVSADITRIMQGLSLPAGYRWEFGGSTKNMNESFGHALSSLVLAVVFIYMILASQFKSFIQPLALMASLPLTLIGVVLMLMMFSTPLSLVAIIGVVMLMGLVTKNAILLLDFAIRARGEHTNEQGQLSPGLARHEALLLAAKVRLRPILMTTLAMIFGMVPLAFSVSEGAEQRAPMGQAVIGGVITSSVLTLVVVPVVYTYLDDLVQWLRRQWGTPKATEQADSPVQDA